MCLFLLHFQNESIFSRTVRESFDVTNWSAVKFRFSQNCCYFHSETMLFLNLFIYFLLLLFQAWFGTDSSHCVNDWAGLKLEKRAICFDISFSLPLHERRGYCVSCVSAGLCMIFFFFLKRRVVRKRRTWKSSISKSKLDAFSNLWDKHSQNL